jgi:hypothetical protein
LINEELKKLPQPSTTSAKPSSPKPKTTKRTLDSEDEDDEVRAFKRRPKAAVNKPMTLPVTDRARKQAIDAAMATVNPNASFAERVAHFDHMAEISQKHKLNAKSNENLYGIKTFTKLSLQCTFQPRMRCRKTSWNFWRRSSVQT